MLIFLNSYSKPSLIYTQQWTEWHTTFIYFPNWMPKITNQVTIKENKHYHQHKKQTIPFLYIVAAMPPVILCMTFSLKFSSSFFIFSKLHHSTACAIFSSEQSSSKNSASLRACNFASWNRLSYVISSVGNSRFCSIKLLNSLKYLKKL